MAYAILDDDKASAAASASSSTSRAGMMHSSNSSNNSRTSTLAGRSRSHSQSRHTQQYNTVPPSLSAGDPAGGANGSTRYSSTATSPANAAHDRRGLSTYQTAAHEPVYMTARTSPIGPPPRFGLPALPPPPSGSTSAAGATGASLSSSTMQGQAGSSSGSRNGVEDENTVNREHSGMMAMAGNGRPVTAVYEPNGHPSVPSHQLQSAHRSVNSNESNSRNHNNTNHTGSSSTSSQSDGRPVIPIMSISRRRPNPEPSYINQDFAGADNSMSELQAPVHYFQGIPITPIYPLEPLRPYFRETDRAQATPVASSSSSVSTTAVLVSREEEGNTSTRSAASSSSMPSKRVLTIALEKAQKAVEHDQAEDAEAAIAAYTESVALLEQVMTRVNESAGSWRQREAERAQAERERRRERRKAVRADNRAARRTGAPGGGGPEGDGDGDGDGPDNSDDEPETEQEAEERRRREARLIRREQMRAEECERLRVIRDTYAERISALREEADERRALGEGSSKRYVQRLSGVRPDAADSRTPPRPGRAKEGSTGGGGGEGRGDYSARRSGDSARAGIGSAMLANSPLSPNFPSGSASSSIRNDASSPSRVPGENDSNSMRTSAVPFPATPNQQKGETGRSAGQTSISSVSGSPPALSLPEIQPLTFSPASSLQGSSNISRSKGTAQDRSPRQQSMLSFSPDSEKSDSATFSKQQSIDNNAASAASAYTSSHLKNASVASYNKDLPNIEGLASFGTSNNYNATANKIKGKARAVNDVDQEDDQDMPEGLATPTPDNSYSSTSAFASTSPPKLAQAERSVAAANAANRSRSGSKASSAVLRPMASRDSLNSTTTSATSTSTGQASRSTSSTQSTSKTPLPGGMQGRYEPPAMPLPPDPIDARGISVGQPRQTRSASVAVVSSNPTSAGQSSHRGSAGNAGRLDRQRSSTLLINPTTTHGTISQRRKSPQIPNDGSFPSVKEHEEGFGSLVAREYDQAERDEPPQTARSLTAKQPQVSANTISNGSSAVASSVPFNVAGSLPMRLRALSQPSKRPGLPTYNSDFAALPPLVPPPPVQAPGMQRADSDPTAGLAVNTQDSPGTPNMPATPVSIEHPSNATKATNAVVPGISLPADWQEPTFSPTGSHLGSISKTAPSNITSFMEPDTPAANMFPTPQNRTLGAGMSTEFQPAPQDIARRPFHFLQRIRASILSGAHVTERLYVPKGLWTQSSVKLIHTETKVRMLDLLLGGLEAIERTGDVLLLDGKVKAGNTGSKLDAANRLMRELESFEGMLDGVQSTLAKKLGYIEQPNGKKGGGSSFGIWSSKLSRSMDRMTKGKNLDAPETYVAAIARLCLHAQILDRHIASLHDSANFPNGHSQSFQYRSSQEHPRTYNRGSPLDPPSSGYAEIPNDRMVYIDARLRRTSEFFGKVICKMLLNDLGIWLEKYSKLNVNYLLD